MENLVQTTDRYTTQKVPRQNTTENNPLFSDARDMKINIYTYIDIYRYNLYSHI